MNNTTIVGNVGDNAKDKDGNYLPENSPVVVREVDTSNGKKKVANFSIADNQGKDKDPIWWDISVWEDDYNFKFVTGSNDKGGYIRKGTGLVVSGRITESKFEDKDGNTRRKKSINPDRIEYISTGGKKDGESSDNSSGSSDSGAGW